ncbi:MAG: hypothetical protein KDH84_05370, partial [Calditrichaeota bacterium]|nr:hypothetical protein [Calditrichota bacterium]
VQRCEIDAIIKFCCAYSLYCLIFKLFKVSYITNQAKSKKVNCDKLVAVFENPPNGQIAHCPFGPGNFREKIGES